MRHRPTLFTAVLLGVGLLAVSTIALADTTLQFKFKKGDVQTQNKTLKRVVDRGVPNSETDVSEHLQTETICDEVSDSGVATLRQRLRKVHIVMREPGETLEYVTDKTEFNDPTLQQIDKIVRPMMGADWVMKCNSRGLVSDVVFPAKTLDILKKSPDAFAGELFSELGLKQVAERTGISLPETAVKPGDKWTTVTELKAAFGAVKYQHERTYIGPGNTPGIEKIQLRVKIELDPDPKSKLPFQVKLKSGSGSGEVLFNNQLGRVTRSYVKSTMVLEQSAPGQTRELTSHSEVTIEDSPTE